VPDAEITLWLERWRGGDRRALEELVPAIYSELRALAHRAMRRERPDHTLQTTELVHEAYLKLLAERRISAANRREFLAAASLTMRRLLVDYARSRKRERHGGGRPELPLEEAERFLTDGEAEEVLAVDLALGRLAEANPRGSEVVQHRYFAGLSLEQTAELLGVSTKTVQRDWLAARAWLRKELEGS
jgi:RNA polymerase sigma factor (TIGR02999 family)